MKPGDIESIGSSIGRRALHGLAATRRVEATATAGSPPHTLMAQAGSAVARLALALAPHAGRFVVFAGPGNNGGDGLEAAACLHALGKPARVVLVASPATLPADAGRARLRAEAAGVAIEVAASEGDLVSAGAGAELVVDALLGLGASRPASGIVAAAIERIAALRAAGARVLAVDAPTGLDVDRGQANGPAVVADATLTLLTLKPGLFTASGRDHAGRVWFADLGASTAGEAADAWLVGLADPSNQAPQRLHGQHKGSFGDVAVVGGAPGMEGAAALAARAAHAAGAGRVFVDLLGRSAGGPDTAVLDPVRPELMWQSGWSSGDPAAVARAVVVCGCGGSSAVRDVLPRLLSIATRLVLDADALNAIASDTVLQTLLVARSGRGLASILTPHPLEAGRLLGSGAKAIQSDRLAAAHMLAERFKSVIVLKGSGTVVATPGEAPRINLTGNAALAGAGTGDVLAGWIGGRWAASGACTFDVATRAVVEHGAAAEPQRAGALRAADLIEALHRGDRS